MKHNYKEITEKFPWTKVRYNEVEPWRKMETGWFEGLPKGWVDVIYDYLIKLDRVLRTYHIMDNLCIEQVKEKWGCYDEKTQVLTKDGWKYFRDVTYEDEFFTLNPKTNNIEYQKPTDIIRYKYNGKMYRLHNRGIDLCVTPNHNLYVSKGSYYNHRNNNEKRTYPFELVTPEKYYEEDKRFLKGNGIWIGKKPDSIFEIKGYNYSADYINKNGKLVHRTYHQEGCKINIHDWLKFLGFYVAEGCSDFKRGTIDIAYNPEDEEELVTSLIKNIGFSVKGVKGRKRIYNKALAKWLIENCGHLAPNKKVPTFIKNLPPEYIKEFLEYLYIGDGHETKTSKRLYTSSEQLAEDVEELILKCGFAFNTLARDRRGHIGGVNKKDNHKIVTKHIGYEVSWLKNSEIEIDMSKAKKTKSFIEKWIDYNDYVSCVTVPNHILYVKRNGKGLWCGNSLRWYFVFLYSEDENCEYVEFTQEQQKGIKIFQQLVWDLEDKTETVCCDCGTTENVECYGGWVHFSCPSCESKRIEEWKKAKEEWKKVKSE